MNVHRFGDVDLEFQDKYLVEIQSFQYRVSSFKVISKSNGLMT